ncbi:hypothetical protein GCM10010253_64020 [Streptomyces badius]|uniref:Uncharacterized protein n=1 Tax=Streptomyces badius TaxID=1941 RepID=A0ABQ2TP70_STRBA|nr:hypothetical protein GCM10010253_64020 [Streptomyces badius]
MRADAITRTSVGCIGISEWWVRVRAGRSAVARFASPGGGPGDAGRWAFMGRVSGGCGPVDAERGELLVLLGAQLGAPALVVGEEHSRLERSRSGA